MENKISLEASGMPGVIERMEKHFGDAIRKAGGACSSIKEASEVKTVPTSVINAEWLKPARQYRNNDYPCPVCGQQLPLHPGVHFCPKSTDKTNLPVPALAETEDATRTCSPEEAQESVAPKRGNMEPRQSDSCGGQSPSAIIGAPDKGREDLSGSTEGRASSRSVDVATRGAAPTSSRPESDQGTHSETQFSPAQILPPFKPIEGPIDPLDPFQDREEYDLIGAYVTRDNREIEILVEIRAYDYHCGVDGVELGNAFTLRGGYIDLSPEESARIRGEFYEGLSK